MSRAYHQMCPIARTLDIVGERWTLLIVRDLFLGKTKFIELMASSPRMPARVLSDRLKMLEASGFVERAIYSEHPPRADYTLTALGRSFEPIAEALFRWGAEHTLTERERGIMSTHLYGTAPKRGDVLKFPRPRARTRRKTLAGAKRRTVQASDLVGASKGRM